MLKKCVVFASFLGTVSVLSYGCSSSTTNPDDTAAIDPTKPKPGSSSGKPGSSSSSGKPSSSSGDDGTSSSSSSGNNTTSSSSSSSGTTETPPACVPKADWTKDLDDQAKELVKEPSPRIPGACNAAEINSITTGVTTIVQVVDAILASGKSCQACLLSKDAMVDKPPMFVFDGEPNKAGMYDNLAAITDYSCVWHEAGDKCGNFEGMANLCGNFTCQDCGDTNDNYTACSTATFGKATSMYSTCTKASTTYDWLSTCSATKLQTAERTCGNILKQIAKECGGTAATATDAGRPDAAH